MERLQGLNGQERRLDRPRYSSPQTEETLSSHNRERPPGRADAQDAQAQLQGARDTVRVGAERHRELPVLGGVQLGALRRGYRPRTARVQVQEPREAAEAGEEGREEEGGGRGGHGARGSRRRPAVFGDAR